MYNFTLGIISQLSLFSLIVLAKKLLFIPSVNHVTVREGPKRFFIHFALLRAHMHTACVRILSHLAFFSLMQLVLVLYPV